MRFGSLSMVPSVQQGLHSICCLACGRRLGSSADREPKVFATAGGLAFLRLKARSASADPCRGGGGGLPRF